MNNEAAMHFPGVARPHPYRGLIGVTLVRLGEVIVMRKMLEQGRLTKAQSITGWVVNAVRGIKGLNFRRPFWSLST
ncbi:hypothetical protein [Vulcanisaeta sp. JCM 16161]|uniref:hypothetical protein n=1 Tax=Vulcanisaeta sp. JCM 16161 TaxID=1295372 RepID=UPI00406C50BD